MAQRGNKTAPPFEVGEKIFPQDKAREAIGITGFTLPTMDRWILSREGRAASLHPFRGGRYLGSGQADKVLAEAGLDGESQYRAVRSHLDKATRSHPVLVVPWRLIPRGAPTLLVVAFESRRLEAIVEVALAAATVAGLPPVRWHRT